MDNKEFGRIAERQAAQFLESKGYKIIELNYRTRLGEVDIIAKDKETVCFVEVKARHSAVFGQPCEAVSLKKQRQISKTAVYYLKENNLLENSARFDVISVLFRDKKAQISLIKNAFEIQEGIG